jgi:hypothetical protein
LPRNSIVTSCQSSVLIDQIQDKLIGGYIVRTSFKSIERDFPHIVEMIVPEGGFGKTLDAMYDFHARHGIQAQRGRSRRDENGRDYIRWCFADPAIAKSFATVFAASE